LCCISKALKMLFIMVVLGEPNKIFFINFKLLVFLGIKIAPWTIVYGRSDRDVWSQCVRSKIVLTKCGNLQSQSSYIYSFNRQIFSPFSLSKFKSWLALSSSLLSSTWVHLHFPIGKVGHCRRLFTSASLLWPLLNLAIRSS
jgi:hypothetical protein